MSLPIIDTYAFPVTLPSSGKTVAMRPYLVREEKILLMAQESNNYDDQIEAIAQIVKNCTDGAVDPTTAPYFDIEYLLLQLRARSVGEVATPFYICHNKINDAECGHQTPIQIKLTDVPVVGLDQPKDKFILKLSDRYTLHLRYPTIYTVHKLVLNVLNNENFKTEQFLSALCDVFDYLEDHENNENYDFSEYTMDEKLQFLDSFSTRNYTELVQFLDELPTIQSTITFECENCKFNHKIILSGVSDFLE